LLFFVLRFRFVLFCLFRSQKMWARLVSSARTAGCGMANTFAAPARHCRVTNHTWLGRTCRQLSTESGDGMLHRTMYDVSQFGLLKLKTAVPVHGECCTICPPKCLNWRVQGFLLNCQGLPRLCLRLRVD
jgi:hypothetical protein